MLRQEPLAVEAVPHQMVAEILRVAEEQAVVVMEAQEHRILIRKEKMEAINAAQAVEAALAMSVAMALLAVAAVAV